LYEQARNVARRLEFELGETQVGGASDGNFAAAAGATGPRWPGQLTVTAHTPVTEHILIDDIPRRGALLGRD
jgi:glutamate carboxypeptidase